ncbi:MAG: transposase [Gammaproteobacteria bacterium]
MVYGLLPLPLWGYVAVILVLTQITAAAVTIFLHRHQAHRALDLHPLPSHFFRFWLWLTTGMITREWVAIHRKHHAFSDKVGDPHSPQIVGIRKVLFDGVDLYRSETRHAETIEKYGHGTPDDWWERNVYGRNNIGLALMLVIDLLLFGVVGITIWAVQMMWTPFFAAGVINGVGHWWGYRNYEVADASRNIVPWGILIGGEELHNNHHAFVSSAKFSSKWWEFDIGWFYIRLQEMLGLARVKKVAPKPVMNTKKPGLDLDTVSAIVTNRFHVMAHYARDVVSSVYEEELNKADDYYRHILKRARGLLTREESLLDAQAVHRLETLLQHSQALEVVYQFRLRLQALWMERTATRESLLQSLQEWCKQAEATGIKALQEFAQALRGYSMQPA